MPLGHPHVLFNEIEKNCTSTEKQTCDRYCQLEALTKAKPLWADLGPPQYNLHDSVKKFWYVETDINHEEIY